MLAWWMGRRYAFNTGSASGVSFLINMAIGSLALGVALLVLVLSVMNGFEYELKNRILNVAPHIRITQAVPIHEDAVNDIESTLSSRPQVRFIEPSIEQKVLLVKSGQTQAVNITGLKPESYLQSQMAGYLLEGSPRLKPQSVLVSQHLADQLDLGLQDRVMVLVASEGFTKRRNRVVPLSVTGIYATHTELDNALAFVDLETAADLAGLNNEVSAINIFTDNVMSARQTAYLVYKDLDKRYWVADWTQSQGNLYHAIQTSRQMVLLMLTVIIAVAAMNIITAMTMVVNHKTKEFAMLMAMGLKPIGLLRIVLVQAVVIALLGITFGVLIGILLALGIGDVVALIENLSGYQFLKSDIYPVTYLPSKIAVMDIVTVVIPAFFIALLAALYPAVRASRLQPADALRYDK